MIELCSKENVNIVGGTNDDGNTINVVYIGIISKQGNNLRSCARSVCLTCFSKMRESSPRVLSRLDTLLLAHCPLSWPWKCFSRSFTKRCNLTIQEIIDSGINQFLNHFKILP